MTGWGGRAACSAGERPDTVKRLLGQLGLNVDPGTPEQGGEP